MRFYSLLYEGILIASVASAQTFPITGTQGGVDPITGARPARQDIKIFQNSGPAWDLYIQALQSFVQTDSTQLLSYFDVAGIHGYPNVPWDGVVGNSDGIGYCAHSTVTFPTWHRPYMALFEQLIWQNAQAIALAYPDSNRDSYVAAAQTLRIPFWDWSVDAKIPAIANVSSIQINTPNGQQKIDNPLYRYSFPPMAANTGIGEVQFTARRSNADQLLQNLAKAFHAGTYALYSNQPNYAQFANAAYYPPGAHHFPGFHPTNSLEHVHNLVHQNVGGQMGDLTVAAFDPLFWLHHANVDRVFAIWQAIYPDQFTVPWNTTQSDYVIPTGTTVDENTPLYPFHSNDQGTLYTSTDVRSTKPFGYTYPELMDWGVNSDPAVLQSNVTAIVNQIYNPTGSSASNRRGVSKRATSLSAANAASYNWVIGIRADKSLLNQTLNIHFYLSTPPADSQLWSTTSVIGTDSVIVSRPAHSPPSSSPQFISGQTFINGALLPLLSDISPSTETIAFLKSNLQWRATYTDESVVNADEMHSLGAVNVYLMGQTVTQTPELDKFPVYGEWKVYGDGFLGEKGWGLF